MVRLEVSKYNKNLILLHEDESKFAEYTLFANDVIGPYTERYMNMLKTYYYLPIDSNAMGHETRKVFEHDTDKFKYVSRIDKDINTFIFCYELKE